MFRKKDGMPVDATAGAATPGTGKAAPVGPRAVAPAKAPTSGAVSGKQAYEMRRAEKAGMGLEKWMAEKDRRVLAEREAVQRARKLAEPRKPGLLRRLLDRAHRPI